MKNILVVSFVIFTLLFHTVYSKKCQAGEFDGGTGCKKCTPKCGGGQVKVKDCTSTSNIICKCPDNKFWRNSILFCEVCQTCKEGEIEVQKCSHAHNRKCSPCQSGYFAKSRYKCVHCKQCQQGEVVAKVCTTSQDTQCKKQEPLSTTVTPFQATVSEVEQLNPTEPTSKDITKDDDNTLLIVVFVVVGVLITFFAILTLIYKCPWSSLSTTTPQKKSKTTTYIIDENASENDTFVNKKAITHDPGYMVRHLSHEVIENLARYLNPPGLRDWKRLASHMGFSNIDIQNFDINKTEACQELLKAWSTQRDSTVYNLYEILNKIQRDDCASILEEVLTKDCIDQDIVNV